MNDDLNSLIASVYEAALDPRLWSSTLEAAADHFQASKTLFYTLETPLTSGGFFSSHNVASEAIAAYDARYRAMDAWILGHQRRFAGQEGAFTGDMLVPYGELVRTEFYADFMKPNDLYHLCNAGVHEREDGGQIVSFAMIRGPRQQAFEERHRRICQLLTPHLQRALLITHRLGACSHEKRTDLSMLDNAPVTLFLVDAHGIVKRMTEAAELLVQKNTHLGIKAGRLVATVDRRFAEAVEEVANRHSATRFSRVLDLHDKAGSNRLHVLIARAGMHLPNLAYVVVGPLGASGWSALGTHLSQLYKVTKAEGRLCEQLAAGHSLAEAAETLSIRYSTAVSQLKSVFAKTGTSRQPDLMRLLIDIAAFG